MTYKVFISHATEDTWVARQMESHIKNAGADTFLDVSNINIGDRFEGNIKSQLIDSKELIVLFTPWSIERRYVWSEVSAAWILEKRIIVVLYGITIREMQTDPNVPDFVKSTDIITINELDRYFAQLQKRVALEAN